MESQAALMRLRGILDAARIQLDLAIKSQRPLGDDERRIVATAAIVAEQYGSRSKGDADRWCQAHLAGDEAWLVVHTKDGTAEAVYYGRLTREQRAVIGR